jgi:Flp pilus assembly protein TadB
MIRVAARVCTAIGVSALLALTAMPFGTAAAEAATSPRVVVILLDTNISPAKTQMSDEQAAERHYVGRLPADVEVALIVFNDRWHTVLKPTTDRSALATAVAGAKQAGASSNGLADALAGAVKLVDRLGARTTSRLLVLTNGEHMTQPSQTTPIPVDVVTFHYDSDDFVTVAQRVATASGGQSAAPGQAGGLTRFLPAKPHPATHAAAPVAQPTWHMTRALRITLLVVFVSLLILTLLGVMSLRPGNRRPHLAGQLERYGPQAVAPVAAEPGKGGTLASSAVGVVNRVLSSSSAEPRLARRLDHAGVSRSPAEWVLAGLCVSAGLAALVTVAFGNVFIGVIAGLLLGWAAMRLALSIKIGRRRAAFDEQLPNVLQLVAGSLQTGLSLAQAFDAVVREDAQPASGEFARALGEARLGVDLDIALDGIAERLNSADLRWVIMAIRIQRETGGNLAEVIRNTVATMRERAYLRRQVRSLSAEGRLSAYVLLALPFVVGGWLLYSNPRYMHPLFSTAFGFLLLAIAAVLVIIGAFWMRNVIRVEV